MPTFETHPETGLRGPLFQEYEAPEELPLKQESTKIYKYRKMIVDSHENQYTCISSFSDINNTYQDLKQKSPHFTRFIASGEALKGKSLKICYLFINTIIMDSHAVSLFKKMYVHEKIIVNVSLYTYM